jgi:hypothetical protein
MQNKTTNFNLKILFHRDIVFHHRQSRRQGLETQAKAPMMRRAIRDVALSTSMHGVAVQPWSFFGKNTMRILRYFCLFCVFSLPLRQSYCQGKYVFIFHFNSIWRSFNSSFVEACNQKCRT